MLRTQKYNIMLLLLAEIYYDYTFRIVLSVSISTLALYLL